jgi:hypothetical protein
MFWIETRTPGEAKQLQERMWGIVKTETNAGIEFRVRREGLYENDEFWADAIRKKKNDPHERLSIAMRHLPLPAAFSEAAISLRSIIRQKKKKKIEYEAELRLLFHLAAIWSFCAPYSERLQQPGYNILARVPFSEFGGMSLTWETLGYENLQLLNTTDRNLMVEAWGEPKTHTTAHEKYLSIWKQYEEMLFRENNLER